MRGLVERIATIADLDGVELRIGVTGSHAAPGDSDGFDLVDQAVILHYGGETMMDGEPITVPPRPWLEVSVEEHGERWAAGMTAAAQQVIAGDPQAAQVTLRQLGAVAAGNVRAVMDDRDRWSPNSARTIAKKTRAGKAGDQPLRDTGQLIQSQRAILYRPGDDDGELIG